MFELSSLIGEHEGVREVTGEVKSKNKSLAQLVSTFQPHVPIWKIVRKPHGIFYNSNSVFARAKTGCVQ